MKIPPRTIIPAALLLITSGITACGGSGQDEGRVEHYSQTIQGVAIDGHLARSMVFADFDNNGTRDPWEPYAFTDDDGYFSVNPKTGINYCDHPDDAGLAVHCLSLDRSTDQLILRVDGGYDTLTGEPFLGQLSRRLTRQDSSPTTAAVITPLTTLISSLKTEAEQDFVLTNIGIQRSDLDIEYVDPETLRVDNRLFNKALKLQKSVTILSDRIEDIYTEIGEAVGTPNDVSAIVYGNLARLMSANSLPLEDALVRADLLQQVLESSEQQVQQIYERRELDSPRSEHLENRLQQYQNSTTEIAMLNQVTDHLFAINSDSHLSDLKGRSRALEALVVKTIDNSRYETHAQQSLAFVLDPANAVLVDQLLEVLNEETADLAAVIKANLNSPHLGTPDAVRQNFQLSPRAAPFANLEGKQIRVSDPDLGFAPNQLQDSEVEIYFKGMPNATSGGFEACVKYIDGANTDGRLGDGNTRGEKVNGQWSLLGASRNSGESYSLLLTINFLGATYQAIMKPAGFESIDNREVQQIRFDYGGEFRSWHSESGLEPQDQIPQSNGDCANRLPSRIGL